MGFDDAFRNRQPEPRALHPRGVERLENLLDRDHQIVGSEEPDKRVLRRCLNEVVAHALRRLSGIRFLVSRIHSSTFRAKR